MRYIDTALNKITMYRLVVYGLGLLALVSIILSLTGALGLQPLPLLISLGIIVLVSYGTNWALRLVWRVPTNTESWLITALILFFVLPSADTLGRALLIAAAAIIAVASKFIVAHHGRHLFNPAAFAMAVLGLTGIFHATWWVGSSVLWPFTLVLGLLVVRRLRRFHLVLSFVVVSLLCAAVLAVVDGEAVAPALQLAVTSSPLLFLAGIMLTEPATMPGRYRQRLLFGALVAALYALHPRLGPVYVYPEVALLVGNLYAWVVNPTFSMRLRLRQITRISDHVYNLAFVPERRFAFLPGQYMEFTLAHPHPDDRGNRRVFSLASAPGEELVHIGIKTYEPSSSYKRALLALKPGDSVYAGQLAGSFTLPTDTSQKLLFIAGGIGITPFRSMVQYMVDTGQQRDVVVIYAVADPQEVAYNDVLQAAEAQGVHVILLLTTPQPARGWQGEQGMLTADFLAKHIPDLADRRCYISGPLGMIDAAKRELTSSGVPRRHIVTDYFSGY